MSDDEIPELEDFSDKFGQFKQQKKETHVDLGDYSKPKEDIPEQQAKQLTRLEPELTGLKKGFLNSQTESSKTDQDIIKPKEKKKNPLEIPEVQKSMKEQNEKNIGNFLINNKDQWLSEDLLKKITQNDSLQKLFSNAEYMQAIQMMQSNPQEVMKKYQGNAEFMMLFQQFAKLMGEHFQGLGQNQQQQQQTQKIQEVKKSVPSKQQTQEDKINDIIQNDPEVRLILQDQKVVAFIEYLQKTRQVDFHRIVQSDPELGKKIGILIRKGILNVQGA